MQWNAQGITNITTRNELKKFINQHRIDIVLLCETLLKSKHKLYLNDFQIYRRDRTEPGGGVAICVNRNIKHKLLPAYTRNTIENISISIEVDNRKIVLTSAYSPRFTTSFANEIVELTPTDTEFILLCD